MPKKALLNYAYAGASVVKDAMPIPTLSNQVDTYFKHNCSADPNAIYVIWMGSNDFLRRINEADSDLIHSILFKIKMNTERLINSGASTILLPQLPDIASSPDSVIKDINNGHTEYSKRLRKVVHSYNQQLRDMLTELSTQYPDIVLITVDIQKLFEQSLQQAKKLGILNLKEACNTNDYLENSKPICDNPDQYLYWDNLHPTAKIHQMFAETIYNLLLIHKAKIENISVIKSKIQQSGKCAYHYKQDSEGKPALIMDAIKALWNAITEGQLM
jgi:outer membrane lipase/esterase